MKKILPILFAFLTLLSSALMSVHASEFKACQGEAKFDALNDALCAVVEVSQGHSNQQSDQQLELFVRKFPALKTRRGSVWLIAGGPGESGTSFYNIIDTFRDTFAQYDVIVPDHRGTGLSSYICPGQAIDSDAGGNLVGEEWGQCFSYMYADIDRAMSFSVTNAAKDLRHLINTLSNEGETYIYGVSYGTQLTLRTVQLENLKVDGIILDGLMAMQGDMDYGLAEHSFIANSAGHSVLDYCDQKDMCDGDNATSIKASLATLLKQSDDLNHYSEKLPKASLHTTLGTMLDVPHVRNSIPAVIQGLIQKDATQLESAVAQVTASYANLTQGYSHIGSSIPLVQIISQSENNDRAELTQAGVEKREKDLLFTSQVSSFLTNKGWPNYSKDEFYGKLPKQLPKTMILHGTLDPKTHYLGAKRHAKGLAEVGEVSFVDITDGAHFIALHSPTCFTKNVSLFLTDKLAEQSVCKDSKTLVNFNQ